jgi:acyl-CoA thioester hydrolase
MGDYRFKLEFEVRDYECDLSGIVNNAVYQNYLEHARHEFLKSRGLNFAQLEERGVTLVVIRIEMDFLYPLRSGDKFYVGLNTERVSRLRFGLMQDIYRLPDEKPILAAKVIGTALNDQGYPRVPKEFMEQITSGLRI